MFTPFHLSPASDLSYGRHGLPILDAKQMAQRDKTTIEERGIPGLELMENAGQGIVRAVQHSYPDANRAVVLAFKGNNGGDGFVVARELARLGWDVTAFHCAPRDDYQGDALTNLERVPPQNLRDGTDVDAVIEQIADLGPHDLIIDALLGTGTDGAPRGDMPALIAAANASRARIVAIDMPTGVNGSTGEVPGDCMRADLTVTMALPKIGQFLPPALDCVGALAVVPIGIPDDLLQPETGQPVLVTREWAADLLPKRTPNSHKGSTGRLLIVGGSPGLRGAPCLAAGTAVAAGAGLVVMGVPEDIGDAVDLTVLEAITAAVPGTDGALSLQSLDRLLEQAELADAVAIGPGLGSSDESRELAVELVKQVAKPVVLDADGLNAFAGRRDQLKSHQGDLVLTPHPGEMGRLLEMSAKEVQQDRWAAARRLAQDAGAAVVLKGANTVIADPEGNLCVNPTGNPGMASGGQGDVLTGLIGALLAQGLGARDAAVAGVFLHGLAGDLLWMERHAPIPAGELVDMIGYAIQATGGF